VHGTGHRRAGELAQGLDARRQRSGGPELLTDNQIRTAFGGDWSRAASPW